MPTYPIVGARFRPPAQAILDKLPAGTKLLLRRQPDNPYDRNAVQVLLFFNQETAVIEAIERACDCGIDPVNPYPDEPIHLGFIPRESAAKLAPLMDESAKIEEEGTFAIEQGIAEWPATLTFAAHGGPMVTFEELG